jgi:hypothetical protein
MFSRIDNIKNGDSYSDITYYTCDITGVVFSESDGWYGNKNVQISEGGMEILLEQWIHRHSGKCGYPIILHYLLQRLVKKIKRQNHIPKWLKKMVLEKCKNKCAECDATENLEFDHIHPVSKGGLTEFSNLQILCKPCNRKKSDKL